MERTNIRYVTPEDIQEAPSFVSIDVSFISLSKVLPAVRELLQDSGEVVCLIKPQFEAGREKVGKKGVVRDPAVHREVIYQVMEFAVTAGFQLLHLDYSPVKGPEGNIEYLLHLQKDGVPEGAADESSVSAGWREMIDGVVKDAHETLDRKSGS